MQNSLVVEKLYKEEVILVKLMFWQNIISIHQVSMLNEMSKLHDITLVVDEDLPKWRKDMGWQTPVLENIKLITSPNHQMIKKLINDSIIKDTIHIFSGINSYPAATYAFNLCVKTDLKIGILSEPRIFKGDFKAILRLLKGKIEMMKYKKRIDFILAIGHLGVEYYTKIGFKKNKIYQFGYFFEQGIRSKRELEFKGEQYKIVYIGQLVKRKGIDVLLKSLENIKMDFELILVGNGEEKENLLKMSRDLKIDEKVNFVGAKSNDEVLKILSSSDLLVLPSRWDGWGAVINESLSSGVPIVCSDHCGAKILLTESYLGNSFKSESIEELRRVLSIQISNGKLSKKDNERIQNFSEKIKPVIIAKYLTEILEHNNLNTKSKKLKPIEPWKI